MNYAIRDYIDNIRVAIYISGLITKIQIFMIGNGFIVFQNILHDYQYTFSFIQINFWSIFSTLFQITPKHAFWMHLSLLWASKIFDHKIYFCCKGSKRSHLVPNQSCMADDPSIQSFGLPKIPLFWADVWTLALAW